MPRRPDNDKIAVLYASIPREVKDAVSDYAESLGIGLSVATNLLLREGLASLGIGLPRPDPKAS